MKPYDDAEPDTVLKKHVGKRTTIGYGCRFTATEWDTYKDGITNEQASALFDTKLKPFEKAVNAKLLYHVSQQQFDAAVLLAYNIGADKFKKSSAAKIINNPKVQTNYNDLAEAWRAYSKITKTDKNGNVVYDKDTGNKIKITLPGLLNRRNCELNVYYNGVYKKW